MIDHTMKIAIVGLGVLGGSYAQALSAKGISEGRSTKGCHEGRT